MRSVFALSILFLFLTFQKVQAIDRVSEDTLAKFPRNFLGQRICIFLKFNSVLPLKNRDVNVRGWYR